MDGEHTSGWHISRQGTSYGPYQWGELMAWAREGRLGPDDLVWQASLPGWMPARQVQGLFPAAAPPAPPPAPEAAAWSGAPAAGAPPPPYAQAQKPSHRGRWAVLAAAGLVVVAAAVVGALFGTGVIGGKAPLVKAPMQGSTVIDVPYDGAQYLVEPRGGKILCRGVEVSIPSGAVDSDTMVELKILQAAFNMSENAGPAGGAPSAVCLGPAVDFGPEGLRFGKPVTIVLPYDEDLLPAGASESDVAMAYWNGATWVAVKSAVDKGRNTVAVKRNHFAGEVWTPVYVSDRGLAGDLAKGPVAIAMATAAAGYSATTPTTEEATADNGGPDTTQATGPPSTTGTQSTTTTVPNPGAGYRDFEENGKYGFKVNDEVLIPAQFDRVRSFAEGLCAVQVGDKWGYIDHTGAWVVQPRYDGAGFFTDGLAGVQTGGVWGFIDRTGRVAIEPAFEDVGFFSEGLVFAVLDGKTGWIDKTGAWVIPPQFEKGYFFRCGLAATQSGGKWGYIDKTGTFVIQPQYSRAGDFDDYDCTATVHLDGVDFTIDTKGDRVD